MRWLLYNAHAGASVCSELLSRATLHPGKIAVITENGQWSYGQLASRVRVIGSTLVSQGLREGTRVLIVLEDRLLLLEAMFAVFSSGGVAVPNGMKLSEKALKRMIEECRPKYLITTKQDAQRCSFPRNSVHIKRSIVDDLQLWSLGSLPLEENRDGEPRSAKPFEGHGTAMVLYASGVSEQPKGVLLTSRSLLATKRNIMGSPGMSEPVRELITLSPSHPFGLGRIQGVFHRGGTAVLMKDPPSPERMAEDILKYSCQALTTQPAAVMKFFGSCENLLQQIGHSVRFVNIAGSHMPLDFRLKLTRLLPQTQILLHYGPLEAPASTSLELHSESGHLDTVGKPTADTTIAVWSSNHRNAFEGQIGEIVVRGPHVSAGYWDDEELAARRYTADRWFRTGDYGYVDADGFLHLLGRRDDLIVSGGEPISPAEIENCLRESHPGLEPCVVGIPDPAGILGQVPALCYTAPPGSEVTPVEIIETLAGYIDEDKTPKLICCLDEFPRGQNGRIDRKGVERMLRKMTKEKKLRALMALDSSANSSAGDLTLASGENLQLHSIYTTFEDIR